MLREQATKKIDYNSIKEKKSNFNISKKQKYKNIMIAVVVCADATNYLWGLFWNSNRYM